MCVFFIKRMIRRVFDSNLGTIFLISSSKLEKLIDSNGYLMYSENVLPLSSNVVIKYCPYLRLVSRNPVRRIFH